MRRRRSDGGQGSPLIRQHCAISDLITKYVSHRSLLFVVAVFIVSKSTFLSVHWCRWTLKHKTYESCLSSRVVFFLHRSLSALLSPTAFFSSSSPPLLFYCNSFVTKLFSISAVRNFIVRYFSGCYPDSPTHCLDNPLSSNAPCATSAKGHFLQFIPHVALCLFV